MYTIFKNDTSIILSDKINMKDSKCHFLWKDIGRGKAMKELLSMDYSSIYFIDEDLEGMWKEFKQYFQIIEASGGIVKNSRDQILFILRHGVWDLPKGKIEIEESKEDAGLREVKEECGFTSLTINGFVGTTYHLYEEKNYEVLKVSYWYDMYSDERELTPQLEEGITELKWVGVSDLKIILENTYPNISLLLDMYQSAIQ